MGGYARAPGGDALADRADGAPTRATRAPRPLEHDRADAPRSTTPSGATSSPQRSTSRSRTSSAAEQLVHDGVGAEGSRRRGAQTRRTPRTCPPRSSRSGRRSGIWRLSAAVDTTRSLEPRPARSPREVARPAVLVVRGSLGLLRGGLGPRPAPQPGPRAPRPGPRAPQPPRARRSPLARPAAPARRRPPRRARDRASASAGGAARRLRIGLQLGRNQVAERKIVVALGALDAQRDPAALLVDLEDPHPGLLAGLDDLAGVST